MRKQPGYSIKPAVMPLLRALPAKSWRIFLFFWGCFLNGYTQVNSILSLQGTNINPVGCGGVVFSPVANADHKTTGTGSAWVRKQADLTKPFSARFFMEIIIRPDGAEDGGAFVLQQNPNSLGTSDFGLGCEGISPSVAITFDTYQNSEDNDPAFDHLSIQANGNIDHNSPDNLAGPVSLEPYYTAITSGGFNNGNRFAHAVTVNWDPSTMVLSTYIDGVLVVSVTKDLVGSIFNNNPVVYWGFTASNTQTHAYPPNGDFDFGHIAIFFGSTITPRFGITPSNDSCFGGPVLFSDSSIYDFSSLFNPLLSSKWFWDFGDGTTSTERSPPPHQFPGPGTYSVKFTVTNELGCTLDTFTVKKNIGAPPIVDFNTSAACTNSPVTFSDASSAAVGKPFEWNWNFNDESLSNDQNPVVSFDKPGQKKINLRVRTSYGCIGDSTRYITVTDKPVPDFSFLQDCNGAVAYQPVITNGVPVTGWQWRFGDGDSSAVESPNHLFHVNASYTSALVAISNSGCPSDTVSKNILIDKLYPFAGNDTVAAAGLPMQLQASGGVLYQWSPATGLNDVLVPNPVALLQSDQTYFLKVTNNEACVGLDTLHIRVFKGPEIYTPNAFTPNSDGHNDVFRLVAPGIRTLSYFRIFNRWGQLVFETTNLREGWNGRNSGQDQPPGTYVWMAFGQDESGRSFSKNGTVTLIR